jgi:hypothetical protein
MDTNYFVKACNGVTLEHALPTLATSEELRAALLAEFGFSSAAAMLPTLTAAKFLGRAGRDLKSFLEDALINDYEIRWSGTISGDADDYPVQVCCRFGVYHVWAMEYDRAGYFLALNGAKQYVYGKWNDVSED